MSVPVCRDMTEHKYRDAGCSADAVSWEPWCCPLSFCPEDTSASGTTGTLYLEGHMAQFWLHIYSLAFHQFLNDLLKPELTSTILMVKKGKCQRESK